MCVFWCGGWCFGDVDDVFVYWIDLVEIGCGFGIDIGVRGWEVEFVELCWNFVFDIVDVCIVCVVGIGYVVLVKWDEVELEVFLFFVECGVVEIEWVEMCFLVEFEIVECVGFVWVDVGLLVVVVWLVVVWDCGIEYDVGCCLLFDIVVLDCVLFDVFFVDVGIGSWCDDWEFGNVGW